MSLQSLDRALDALCARTWQTSTAATVLVVLVLLVHLLFRRAMPPRWHYALGLLVMLRLAVPFVPASSLSVFNLANHFTSPPPAIAGPAPLETLASFTPTPAPILEALTIASLPESSIAVSRVAPAARRETLVPAHPPTPNAINYRSVAKYLWLAGCIAMFAIVARRHRHFVAQLRRWEPVREPRVLELLEACKTMLGVRRHIALLAADSLNTPALFGVFRPRLLIPAEMLCNLDDGELRHIFLHELVHLQRGDVLVNYAMLVLRSLHWFNPFVWLALRRLRADQELACDAAVLSRLAAPEQLRYGRTLIKLLADFPAPAPGFCPGAVPFITHKQTIKRRIQMIANFKPTGRLTLAASLALLVALACVTFTRAADNSGSAVPPTKRSVAALDPQPADETNGSSLSSAPLITVFVAADGTATLDGNPQPLNREQLKNALRAEVENDPHVRLNIQAVSATKYEDLAWVLDVANQLSIKGVTLHTAAALPQPFGKDDAQTQALQRQLAELDAKIAEQERALGQFAGYPAPGSPGSSNFFSEMPSQAHQTLLEKQKELLEKETLLSQLNKLSADELRQVLPTTIPDALLTQSLQDLNAAQARYAALRANVGANNPEAAGPAALVAKLNSQVDERVTGILQGLKTQIETDRQVIATLKRQFSDDAQRSQYDQYIRAKAELDQLKAARDQAQAKLAAYQQARAWTAAQNESGPASAIKDRDPNGQTPAGATIRGLDALREEIAKLDEEIRQTETNLYAMRSKMAPDTNTALTPETQMQLNAQILELKANAAEMETTLKNLKNLTSEELPRALVTIYPDNVLQGLLGDLAAAQSKLAELSANLRPDHPDVKTVRDLIADKNAQIDARTKGILAALEVKIEAIKAQITERQNDLETAKARYQETLEQNAPYFRAMDRLHQLRELRDVLMLRLGQETTNNGVPTNDPGR